MSKWIISYFIICLPFIGLGQQLHIVDDSNFQPLEYAMVLIGKSNVFLQSDHNGIISLPSVPAGSKAYIQLMGYHTQEVMLDTLNPGQTTIYMIASNESLQEFVISANRSQQIQHLVAQPVHTQSRAEIFRSQPQTSADLLQNSEKVYVQKSQMGGGSPMIRGFAANRLLLVVDGVRMNNAIFRSGNVHNVLSIDPLSITQSNIIFGPGAVNYGSDAIGGVMSFSTLQPRFNDSTSVNALARWSSANLEKTAHVDIRTGSEQFAYVFSLSHSDFSDLRMGSNALPMYQKPFLVTASPQGDIVRDNPNPLIQNPSAYKQTNFLQKFAFRPNANWQIEYGLHYAFTSDIPRYDRYILTDDVWQPQFAEWYYGPQTWLMNAVNISYRNHHRFFDHIRLTAAHQVSRESRNDRRFNSNITRSREETVDAISINLDLEKRLAQGHFLLYGIEAVHNVVGSEAEAIDIRTGAKLPLSTRYPDRSTWSSYAAFANYKWNWSEKLSTIAGIRYNSIHTRAEFDQAFFDLPFTSAKLDHQAVNGSLGAVYLVNNSMDVSFTAGTGFRAPNIDDIGKVFDSEPGNVVVPNPTLKPEIAYSLELALNYEKEKFNLGFSAFHTWLEQALIRSDYSLNGRSTIIYDGVESNVQALVNAAQARVYGLQADAEWILPANLSLKANLNYTRGAAMEDGIHQPLRHVPPLFASAFINYKMGLADVSLFGRFNERMPAHRMPLEERNNLHIYPLNDSGLPYSPSWHTLNFRSTWYISPSFTIFAAVENITDRGYWPFAGGIAAPGRNVMLSAKFNL